MISNLQRIKPSRVAIFITVSISAFLFVSQLTHTPSTDISIKERINNPKLNIQQDDPQLLEYIRQNHLQPPSKLDYQLNSTGNPSFGQIQSIIHLLRNDSNGFFVEAGANDGEWGSNTLYLETELGWGGLLVEASPLTYEKLISKHRKAWHSNAALSTKPRPMMATFYENPEASIWGGLTYRFYHKNDIKTEVQCIPLYSLLLAVNRTTVDFLSLDLEGSELDVLRTIPFDKVNIKAIAVEVINGKEGPEPVKDLMKQNNFHLFATVSGLGDLIFINDELFQKHVQNVISKNMIRY